MEWVDLSNEAVLDPRRKKKWLDKKRRICYMTYPRSMGFTWGKKDEYWTWENFQDPSGDYFEIANLRQICWFEIAGKLSISELSPQVDYEGVFVVKLSDWAHGWDAPVNLKLTLPEGKTQERRVALMEEPREQWLELGIGNFRIQKSENEAGEIECCLSSITGYWKHGLSLKGLMIRPIN